MNKNTNNKQFKKRHELPAPEEIEESEYLAFTVNINTNGELMSTISLYPRYMAFFNSISKYARIEMHAEWSSKAKYHYHGSLVIKDLDNIIPFYMYMNDPKVLSNFTYSLKKIFGEDGLSKWETYITKQNHLARVYLKSIKLPYKYDSSILNKKNQNIYKYFDQGDQLRADLGDDDIA